MKRKAVSMGLIMFFIAGCATMKIENSGTEIKEEPAKVIKVGVTTRQEIIKLYGEPLKSVSNDGSEELVYEFRRVETPVYLGGHVIGEASKSVTVKNLKVVILKGVVQSYKYETKEE